KCRTLLDQDDKGEDAIQKLGCSEGESDSALLESTRKGATSKKQAPQDGEHGQEECQDVAPRFAPQDTQARQDPHDTLQEEKDADNCRQPCEHGRHPMINV